jgi:hypothetical protein
MSLHSTTSLSPVSAGEAPLLHAPVVMPKPLTQEDVKTALRGMRDGFAAAFGPRHGMPEHCLGQAVSNVVTPSEFRQLMVEVWNEK